LLLTSSLIAGIIRPQAAPINRDILAEDSEKYGDLKKRIILDTLAVGGVIALAVGVADGGLAKDYLAGLISGVFYLALLSLKTDMVGSERNTSSPSSSDDNKLKRNVPSLRFLAPVFALTYVAVNNAVHGTLPSSETNVLSTVSPSQFAATVGGFLTYRGPLLVREIGGVVQEELGGTLLPGSIGVALELGKDDGGVGEREEGRKKENVVVVVSGARGYVDEKMVEQAVGEVEGKVVTPEFYRRSEEGYNEGDMVGVNGEGGWRKEDMKREGVKVIITDVEGVEGLRRDFDGVMVGVWCSDTSLDKIRNKVETNCERRGEEAPKDEVLVADIEYGIVSGVFEFTVLGEDEGKKEVRKAIEYAKEI